MFGTTTETASGSLPTLSHGGVPPVFDAVYQQRRDYVRRVLRGFGVVSADLDDVCHEVFLVVYRRLNEPSEELGNVKLWLHEICRRSAAGYRRRRFRRSEALVADPSVFAELIASDVPGAPETNERLRAALERLDPRGREVLLLGALEDVSISDLALLAECDRKTARKRLTLARERMARMLKGQPLPAELALPRVEPTDEVLFDPMRVELDAELSDPNEPQLEVRLVTPFFAAATWGRVFMTIWNRASLTEMEALSTSASEVYHATGGKFAYLTLVERECGAPEFGARQRILEIVAGARPYLSSYATVLSGGASRFVVPIMNVIFFVAGIEFPARFFGSIAEASGWTTGQLPDHAGHPAELAEVLAYLRALRSAQT